MTKTGIKNLSDNELNQLCHEIIAKNCGHTFLSRAEFCEDCYLFVNYAHIDFKDPSYFYQIPSYCTEIATAWKLIEYAKTKDVHFKMHTEANEVEVQNWRTHSIEAKTIAETIERAIAEAFCMAFTEKE